MNKPRMIHVCPTEPDYEWTRKDGKKVVLLVKVEGGGENNDK